MARRQQPLILQLRITEDEIRAIINPVSGMSPPRQRIISQPGPKLSARTRPDLRLGSLTPARSDTIVSPRGEMGLLCGWCTLPITEVAFGIPVSQDPATRKYRTTHSFHHPRCACSGAKYHYSHKLDAVMKLVRELYGHGITPAPPKEVMARFTVGGMTDEEYDTALRKSNQMGRIIYAPMISPLTAELFNMDLRS